MKLRHKEKGYTGSSNQFNPSGLGEIIVGYDHGDMSSEFIKDYSVYLEKKQEWKDLAQAFKDHDVIPDNYNHYFGEPQNEEERTRGYSL